MNMNMIDSHSYIPNDDSNVLLMLREIADKVTYSIITSTMNSPKTASEICCEYRLPLSSTYKKIQKLQKSGLISIEKIQFDVKGKKILYYRSKIKSLEVNLNQQGLALQLIKRWGSQAAGNWTSVYYLAWSKRKEI
jgi:predicted transcriptional regulator